MSGLGTGNGEGKGILGMRINPGGRFTCNLLRIFRFFLPRILGACFSAGLGSVGALALRCCACDSNRISFLATLLYCYCTCGGGDRRVSRSFCFLFAVLSFLAHTLFSRCRTRSCALVLSLSLRFFLMFHFSCPPSFSYFLSLFCFGT